MPMTSPSGTSLAISIMIMPAPQPTSSTSESSFKYRMIYAAWVLTLIVTLTGVLQWKYAASTRGCLQVFRLEAMQTGAQRKLA